MGDGVLGVGSFACKDDERCCQREGGGEEGGENCAAATGRSPPKRKPPPPCTVLHCTPPTCSLSYGLFSSTRP